MKRKAGGEDSGPSGRHCRVIDVWQVGERFLYPVQTLRVVEVHTYEGIILCDSLFHREDVAATVQFCRQAGDFQGCHLLFVPLVVKIVAANPENRILVFSVSSGFISSMTSRITVLMVSPKMAVKASDSLIAFDIYGFVCFGGKVEVYTSDHCGG